MLLLGVDIPDVTDIAAHTSGTDEDTAWGGQITQGLSLNTL